MKKYIFILINSFNSQLEYRSNVFATFFYELITFGGLYLLFSALKLFNPIYYLYAFLVGFFVRVDYSSKFSKEVLSGEFSARLIKPINLTLQVLAQSIGERLFYIINSLFAFSILFVIFTKNVDVALQLNLPITVPLFLILLMLSSIYDLLFCWFSFWIDDAWAFKHLKSILNAFLGGSMIPLVLFPNRFRDLLYWTPFPLFYDLPISLLTSPNYSKLLALTLSACLWVIIMVIFSHILLKFAIRKYSAYGS